MRNFLIILILVAITFTGFAQQPQYQTFKSVMKISAFKDGENIQWENKNVTVRLDYQIGSFITRLKNSDFYYSNNPTFVDTDSIEYEREFILQGIFPITEIIDQRRIEQSYVVELQLINQELMLNRTIMFDMKVTRPSQSSQGNYRVFLLHGKMYNRELQLPGFVGFDNEIEVYIGFNGFWNRR